MLLKDKKFVFLGDSITWGSGTSGADKVYHVLLKNDAGLKEAVNYGIGGTRYAIQKGTPHRPKDDYVDVNSFCERFDQMDDDADGVVGFGGTNDYGHGDAPLGKFEDRTPDSFYGACHYLYSGLIKKYLGKPIVIITPLHRANESSDTGNKSGGEILKVYVDAIREVAEFYSLPVLDLYASSGLQPQVEEIKNAYIPDGLHPNDEGHKIIAYKLKKFLENL